MPLSAATRELCAARLLSTLDAVSRVSRPRPVSANGLLCSQRLSDVLSGWQLSDQLLYAAHTGLSRCVSGSAPHPQVQRDQPSTADAAEDAEGQPKPAKRPRRNDQAAAAAAQQGEGAAAMTEPASAQQPGAGEQPDYLAGLSAFVRAAERIGAQLVARGPDVDRAAARSALREAEETVSKLMAGESAVPDHSCAYQKLPAAVCHHAAASLRGAPPHLSVHALAVLVQDACLICSCLRPAEEARADKVKLAAWASLLRLLALYAMGSADVVDAELASDLVVITASAFEGAEARAEGECHTWLPPLAHIHGARRDMKQNKCESILGSD